MLDARWQDAGLNILICVRRSRQGLDGSSPTTVTSYFSSNAQPTRAEEAGVLFDAMRQHWRIAVMPYVRDVTLSEDALGTSVEVISGLMVVKERWLSTY